MRRAEFLTLMGGKHFKAQQLLAGISNVYAVYGTTRLVPAYQSQTLRITRRSDLAVADFGFRSDTDIVDTRAVASFLSGETLPAWVTTVYDQSGNGLNITHGAGYSIGSPPVKSAAGSNYQVGDTITLVGGAVLTVATVSGTAVATVTVTNRGVYSSIPTNPVAQASSSGSGTGATFTCAWTLPPSYKPAAFGGAVPAISFNEIDGNSSTRLDKCLFLPTISIDRSNAGLIFVGQEEGQQDGGSWFQMFTADNTDWWFYGTYGAMILNSSKRASRTVTGSLVVSTVYAKSSRHIHGIRVNGTGAGNIKFYSDNQTGTAASTTAKTLTQGQFGTATTSTSSTANSGLNADAAAIMMFNSAFSDADFTTIKTRAAYNCSLPLDQTNLVLLVGDSVTAGFASPTGSVPMTPIGSFPNQLQYLLSKPCRIDNVGVPSTKITDWNTATPQANLITNHLIAGGNNIVVVFVGSNDGALSSPVDGHASATAYLALCATQKSVGFQHVIAVTLLPRTSIFSGGQTAGGFETFRTDFNNDVRAGASGNYDVLIDIAADPTIGPANAAWLSATGSDGGHPPASAQAIIAQLYAAAVNPLLV